MMKTSVGPNKIKGFYQDGLLVKKEQLPDNTGDHEVLLQQLVQSEKSGFKLEVNSGIIRIDAVMLMAP
ncbi:MAG: hypothetical protein GX227_10375 [Clostridiaceae bacterium]|nr:hypothetical protein [Clostridiaceae bacterium]